MKNGWLRFAGSCGLVGLGALTFVSEARAQTSTSYSESITSYPGGTTTNIAAGMISGSHCFTLTTPCGNGFSYTADAEPTGGGLAHVTLSATGLAGIFSAQVQAGVSYGIFLVGAPDVLVPVNLTSTIMATASNTGVPARGPEITSLASLTIKGPSFTYSKQCHNFIPPATPAGCTAGNDIFGGGPAVPNTSTSALSLLSNTLYSVVLTASATSVEFGTADAYVDPIFTIDPAFASNFTLLGVPSDGPAGVPGAVPEPAIWGMMLLGFGLVGGVMRRRGKLPRSTHRRRRATASRRTDSG